MLLKPALLLMVVLAVAEPLQFNFDIKDIKKALDIDDDDIAKAKEAWGNFKQKFKKAFHTPDEDAERFKIYLQNYIYIKAHNANVTAAKGSIASFLMEDNKFADWKASEYSRLLGFRSTATNMQRPPRPWIKVDGIIANISIPTIPPNLIPLPPFKQTKSSSELPPSVNWTAKGYVNPVQNQGQCGDCWSFSACGSLEGQYFKATGKSAILSEQNLLDCATSYGNQGCNGGSMVAAFIYIQQNSGINFYSTYLYTGKQNSCQYKTSNSAGTIPSFQSVYSGSEGALQQAVAEIGPVSVGIDASQPSFQLYKSGVYSTPLCSSTSLDHAVLAVGYGTTSDTNEEYWLIKNSWGTDWGMNGYMMLARNKNNMCGIASDASFPTDFQSSGVFQQQDSQTSNDVSSTNSAIKPKSLSAIFNLSSIVLLLVYCH